MGQYPIAADVELHASGQSVFTVALHPSFPNPPLAVSGGEDDAGFIFCPIPSTSSSGLNSSTIPPTRLGGHTDSVVAVGWSFDGELVATGGMDGRVRVWRHVKRGDEWKDWEFLTSLETGSEITVSPLPCLADDSGSNGTQKETFSLRDAKMPKSGCGNVGPSFKSR